MTQGIQKKLGGSVFRSSGSEFGEKVFYAENGHRHWIRNIDWFHRNDFNWDTDVTDVPSGVLLSLLNGGNAPVYNRADLSRENLTSIDLREIAASELSGLGIEFGAGASPFPTPLNCVRRFADPFTYDQLISVLYPGQNVYDLIRPDYVTDIKTLRGIPDESMDFIIACHVIEHTNNPLAAVRSCHRALKSGGSLVLVVPDMTKTFDKNRALTDIDHLIADYESPSHERDYEHYVDFYTNAFSAPEGISISDHAKAQQNAQGDIHYHTFTFESFKQIVTWCQEKDNWHLSFSHQTLLGQENIECYFVLTKGDSAETRQLKT
jgi:SAM-dependent methyltransferase